MSLYTRRGRARLRGLVAAWALIARGSARCDAAVTASLRRTARVAGSAALAAWRGVVAAGGEARAVVAARVVQECRARRAVCNAG
ncbi:hypothetical protein T484DRAFT_1821177 [Baffinella frigidus]|nr:hypothetical protein T484DRAFT_1821177 [Cryptophyta sp. CCMP2293]